MRPITFSCEQTLQFEPEEIARQILDLAKWPEFRGYGPIPGIAAAYFEIRTGDIVGSQIRVTNLDGSSHVEEIVDWRPDRCVRLRMHDFSPPLCRLAREFEETWEFSRIDGGTRVVRSFRLFAKSVFAKLVLWGVSFFLKAAINRHLQEMTIQK